MSILSALKAYWSGNGVLTAALPVSKVFLGYVPPSVGNAFPYVVVTVISNIPTYVTHESHVQAFRFQLTVWNSDFNAASNLADVISGQFDNIQITASTLNCQRSNRFEQSEINDANYVYSVILEFEWLYNSSTT